MRIFSNNALVNTFVKVNFENKRPGFMVADECIVTVKEGGGGGNTCFGVVRPHLGQLVKTVGLI